MENLAYSIVPPGENESPSPFSLTPKHELASFLFTLAMSLVPTPAQAVLSQTDRCGAVSDLQNALWDKGLDPGGVDGVFGVRTRSAVEAFQRDRGLTQDGVVGAATASALGLDPTIACTGNHAARQAPVEAWSSSAWVNTLGGPLNVRSQPDKTAAIIDHLPNGSQVNLESAATGDWVKIQGGGWVATAWLQFTPPASSSSASSTRSNTGDLITYHILPGWTLDDVAAYLEYKGFFSASAFRSAAAQIPRSKFSWLPKGLYDLEGFMYPDTYEIAANATPYQVIDQMLARFEAVALPAYDRSGTHLGLYDWVILSSMVEKEALHYDEQPIIAGVFLNRLEDGRRLESDPTVEYALGIHQTKEAPLTLSEVRTESPFNTYLHSGLPPAPIASPGMDSLDAVLHPTHTDYLYFVACYDGTHQFNYTLKQHERDRDTTCAASRGG